MEAETTAVIFNVERFATEDGKGIRTVVFMKGCTLHCMWCANPESQTFKPVVIYNNNLCHACGKCVDVCTKSAINYSEKYGLISDAELCTGCGKCVDTCLYNARTLSGRIVTSDELMNQLLRDKKYFDKSGGGVTFSGGEPLLQSEFILEMTKRLKEQDIPVLIETCGEVDLKAIDRIINEVSAIYFDLKHIDSEIHRKYTGKGNERILTNLFYLNEFFDGELSVRYPYIPGVNSDADSIDKAIEYVRSLKNVDELVFLPYHRLGLPKYLGLGRPYEMGDMKSLNRNELDYLIDRYRDIDLNVRIG